MRNSWKTWLATFALCGTAAAFAQTPAATAPEVRGTYNPTPQLYGELGNAARSALTNEYRDAYNPEVRGPVHPSILSSR